MFKRLLGTILLVGILVTQSIPQAPVLAQALCDQAQFVSDVNVPDGTSFAPGAAFNKAWRLKNIGTCTWTTSYTLVWAGGDQMGGPVSVVLPVTVAPGQTADLSVSLIAPTPAGITKGYGSSPTHRGDNSASAMRRTPPSGQISMSLTTQPFKMSLLLQPGRRSIFLNMPKPLRGGAARGR